MIWCAAQAHLRRINKINIENVIFLILDEIFLWDERKNENKDEDNKKKILCWNIFNIIIFNILVDDTIW